MHFSTSISSTIIASIAETYGTATAYSSFGCGFARESVETHPLCRLKEVNGSVTFMVPESLRASLGETSWVIKRAYSFIFLRSVRQRSFPSDSPPPAGIYKFSLVPLVIRVPGRR